MPNRLSRPARWVVALAAFFLTLGMAPAADAGKLWVYVGTYTNPKSGSEGIYRFDFDPATGKLTPAGLAAEAMNPSFLAIHPTGKYLFAVAEFRSSARGGGFTGRWSPDVSSYRINPATGALSKISHQPAAGEGPCHVSVDRAGRTVFVANYGSGSVSVFKVNDAGELTGPTMTVKHTDPASRPDPPQRQAGPHAHAVELDAANRFAFVPDLGLDQVKVYRINADKGQLTPNDPPAYHTAPGAGPRHLAFHPDGKRAYLINELNSTLSALDYDPDKGVLTERQTVSTLPAGWKGNSTCAEVVVHPSGKFVYGSNRGHDSIAAFAIEPDGKLRLVGHQGEGVKTPRSFNIDSSGKWMIVANQDGNSLVVFKIDQQTGALSPTGIRTEVGGPVCVVFWPAK